MLLGLTQQEINEWSSSLHSYEKSKRTKRPFGRTPPTVERRSTIDVIQRQMKFNPVLQSFRDAREESRTIEQEEVHRASEQIKFMKNNYKYAADYDIINLSGGHSPLPASLRPLASPQVRKKEHKDPTYQPYNIINGSQYTQAYLQRVGLKQQKHHQRNIHPQEGRTYNIISGRYASNHQERTQKEQEESNRKALSRSQDLRVYDAVNGRYYNPQHQEHYQAKRMQKEMEEAKMSPRVPPSYMNRQSLVLAEGAQPPSVVKELDRRAQLAKQRYKLRYLVEQGHQKRGEWMQQRDEERSRRRMKLGHVLEERGREFDIMNAERYANNGSQEVFGKEVTGSPYQWNHIKTNAFQQF